MLGRNTEMNLLQMNKQKNESACGIPFIFLVYLTGGFRIRGVFCNFL